ncbi:sortase [Ruminococcaceae bacterium OttesenSCG-928-A11]|nr:sortase [Ruminococcaceae bacterium OttesenSCG-928-A11]
MTHNLDKDNREKPIFKRSATPPAPREVQIERARNISHSLADETARQQAEAESRRQYHEAWQQYYQQYYQHYYLEQLEEQKRILARNIDNEPKEKISPKQEAVESLRKELLQKINDGARSAKSSRHFKPILAGVIVVIIALLIQYNQFIVAGVYSFVSPGSDTASLIVTDGSSQPISPSPEVIIPKLSVKAPIVFNDNDRSEAGSQEALKNGVLYFPTSSANAKPGEKGNTVILGHSSADAFSGGNYKFIFVQLNRLVAGDLFYIDYQSVRYGYEVMEKKVIAPDDLQQLNMGENEPFATLVTCDPPGTATNRLLVVARQISPNPDTATITKTSEKTKTDSIPGSPPTLFERLFR